MLLGSGDSERIEFFGRETEAEDIDALGDALGPARRWISSRKQPSRQRDQRICDIESIEHGSSPRRG